MLLSSSIPLLLLCPSIVLTLSSPRPRGLPAEVALPPDSDDELDEEPGCADYSGCGSDGINYWNTLQTTLLNPQAVDRSTPPSLFEDHYIADVVPRLTVDADLRQSLRNRDMDISHIDLWQVSSNNSITKQRDPEPAYNNLFDTDHGFLIAEGNWRAKDSQRKLQWSEAIYQTWKLAEKRANELAVQGKGSPPGGPISNLQSVVRHSITNQGTQSVTRAAYAANDWIPGSDGPEEWRRFTETDKQFFFFALIGTENVKGLLWLLRDHAVEIGRKEPATIWTRWCSSKPDIWYVTTGTSLGSTGKQV